MVIAIPVIRENLNEWINYVLIVIWLIEVIMVISIPVINENDNLILIFWINCLKSLCPRWASNPVRSGGK